MKREIYLDCIQKIVDEIHNSSSQDVIRKECAEFKELFMVANIQIQKSEINILRLRQYIDLLRISKIPEERFFRDKKDYLSLLEEYENELWKDVSSHLDKGGKLFNYT